MTFNLLSSAYLADTFEPVAKWLTIGFISALAICLLVTLFVKREILGQVAKNSLITLVFYALVMGIALLVMEIAKKYDSAYLDKNWVNQQITTHVFLPILITLVIALIGGITLFVVAKKKPSAFKITALIVGILCVVGIIVSLILIAVYYSNNIVGDGYYTEGYGELNSIALYVGAGLLIAIIVALSFIIGRKNKAPFDTKAIATAGICLAISFVLSYIKFEVAWLQGGSITLVSFLPICIFAYAYGMKKGLLVGLIYGILQAIQDPFIVHPAQFLLDYPVAFSSIAMAGMLTDLNVLENMPRLKFALSCVFTGIFRYVCHVLSGMFAFGAYALDAGQSNFFIFSAVYNSYVFVDIALVIVVGVIMLSSKAFQKEVGKLSPLATKK